MTVLLVHPARGGELIRRRDRVRHLLHADFLRDDTLGVEHHRDLADQPTGYFDLPDVGEPGQPGPDEELGHIAQHDRVAAGELVLQHGKHRGGEPLHRDPFDRMIVAQARLEGLVVITADAKIAEYGEEVLW